MRAASCSSIWPARTWSAQACMRAMHAVISHLAGRSVRKEPSACPRFSSAPIMWCAAWWLRVTASGLRSSATAAAIAPYRARCCQAAAIIRSSASAEGPSSECTDCRATIVRRTARSTPASRSASQVGKWA